MRKLAAVLSSMLSLMLSLTLSLMLMCAGSKAASATSNTPQTARQALLEMFFSKDPGNLLKHLPAVTRAAIEKSGAMTSLQQYSLLAAQFQKQGTTIQTFETGKVILATTDSKTGQKTELVVESDSPQGDRDDIQVSIHLYKNDQPQRMPFMPVIIFSMKMESGVWTLNEVGITMKLPLADPDLLKSISDGMKASAVAAAPQVHVQPTGQVSSQLAPQIPMRTFRSPSIGSDSTTLAAVRMILTAETTYAATYSGVGVTCKLSDLDGFGASEASEHQAMLIDSGLASGKQHGYAFSLSGCAGQPATGFQLTATPMENSFGHRAFCADQSGTIRSSADGSAATCLSKGTPVQ